MPRRPDARIGDGSERRLKLLHRNAGNGRPEGTGLIKVEALMQVESNPQSGLVDRKEVPQPCAEEGHHGRITVGKAHGAIPFCSLAGVQGHARGQKRLPAQAAEQAGALAVHGHDLGRLPALQDIWSPLPGPLPGTQFDLHIPHPPRYR
jgi:hypothetical protein